MKTGTPLPVRVNRAPVLTLWAAIVAGRVGNAPDIALTLGRFVADSSARAKDADWASSTVHKKPRNAVCGQRN